MITTYEILGNKEIQNAMSMLLRAFEKADFKLTGITFNVKQDKPSATFMGVPTQVMFD